MSARVTLAVGQTWKSGNGRAKARTLTLILRGHVAYSRDDLAEVTILAAHEFRAWIRKHNATCAAPSDDAALAWPAVDIGS